MGYSKLKIPKVCEQCGKPFEAKTVITRFCSKECGHKADRARKKAERKEVKQQELIAKIMYADGIRKLRQREYDNADLYSDTETAQAEQTV
jgi:endogenous inhibitor of DNA gyrase (YacG/DUF329 family)